jgi:hypothetical protein
MKVVPAPVPEEAALLPPVDAVGLPLLPGGLF